MYKGKIIKALLSAVVMFGLFLNSFTIDFSALFNINSSDRQLIKLDNKVWAQDFDPAVTASPFTTGNVFTFVRLPDGTVKATGENSNGELGLGDNVDRSTFTSIPNLTGVKQVFSYGMYTFALMNDGTVKSWGVGGVLGQGDTTSRNKPTAISGLTGVKQIVSSGYSSIYALMNDGTVKSWGRNNCGQLGLGDTTDRYTPTTIPGLTGVKQLVAGYYTALALMNDGTVKAWGYNGYGQLGFGDQINRKTPTTIHGLIGVKSLIGGFNYVFALMNDGSVKSWGGNQTGELGLGDTDPRYSPTNVSGLTGLKQLFTDIGDVRDLFAIMSDGTVKAWGYNANYELGLGDTSNRYFPTTISGLTGVTQIVRRGACTYALINDGTMKIWGTGARNYIQFGLYGYTPAVMLDMTGVNQLCISSNGATFALMADGTVKAWGFRGNTLGLGKTDVQYNPATIPDLTLFLAPVCNINTPLNGSIFSEADNVFLPQISVSDADNDVLTCRYYIDSETLPRDTKTATDTITAKTINFTALDMGTLTEGNHTIKYTVSNERSATLTYSVGFMVDKSAPTVDIFKVSSAVNSITITGSATDSIAGLADSPYSYVLGSDPISWGTGTTKTFENLIPDTLYEAKFEAQDKKGHIAIKTQSIYTKGAVPLLSVSKVTSYSLDVATADNNPNTTQYLINVNGGAQYVTQEGSLTSTPVWIILSNKKITVNGLNPSTTYTFQAKARNAENIETAMSPSVSGTTLIKPPAAPANIIATATDKQITVSWDAVGTATGYEIQTDGKPVDVGTNLTYTHTQLSPGTPHTYQVRAKNAGGAGAWSTQITKSTLPTSPNIPVNVVAVPQSTSITITWSNVPMATGYDIEVDGALVANGPTTNYIHSSLSPGTHHSYRVRSINPGGKSDWSVMVSTTTTSESSPVPANLTAVPSRNEISLTWDAVNGATGYEIEVDGVRIDNNTRTAYIHKNLAPASQHMYRVRSKKNGVASDWSAAIVAETLSNVFGTPTGLKADAGDTSITLSWNPVSDATGYDVEADGGVIDNETETSALITGLEPGTPHTYRVRAKSASQTSEWSEPMQVTTFILPTPVILNTASTETTIEITWGNAMDTSGGGDTTTTGASATYELEADGSIITDITETTYTYGGLTSGTQHVFRVRAKNENGVSNWSIPVTKSTTFSQSNSPTGLFAMLKSSSAVIMWQKMDGAVSYDIDVDGTLIENITDQKYEHTGLLPGSKHIYKVRANNDTGDSNWTEELNILAKPEGPAMPTNLTTSSNTSGITVSWDKVTGADEYEIEVDGVPILFGNGTSYQHSGLTPDTQHSYRVRSKNLAGYSPWSETVSIKTKSSTMTYPVEGVPDEEFDLVFSASDIQDIGQYTFTITYDPAKLEAVDLCSITPKTDNTAGLVIGTDIQIVQFTPGTIVFKKTGTTQSYQAWSGAVNTIRFRSLADGQSDVVYSFQ